MVGPGHHRARTQGAPKAISRRSTSRRTVTGSGRGSSFLKQAFANLERAYVGTAVVPACSRFSGFFRSRASINRLVCPR